MMSNSSQSVFQNFTNLYSLSKTLRFELKPTTETQKMLEEAKVFKTDKTIQKKYEATKPYFDRLHREFVKESLHNVVLSNLNEYFEVFEKWRSFKIKDEEKEADSILINILENYFTKKEWENFIQKKQIFKKADLEKVLIRKESELRKEIVTFFDAQGKVWAEKYSGLKNKNIEVLFEEAVFEAILKIRFGHEKESQIVDENTGEIISIFESWKGFTGYFDKFLATRKNFYKDDGTSTALATRIINQNLKRFCDNILNFENIKEKVDFSEFEKSFGKSLFEIFSLEFYNSCLLQDGIDFYNKILGGEILENGEKRKGLNELINLHKQKTGEKLPFFKSLDKQILSEKEKFIDEITKETLLKNLQNFLQTAQEKTKILNNLFNDFLQDQEKYDLEQIYIDEKVFNPNSCKYVDKESIDFFHDSLLVFLKKAKIISGSAKSLSDFIPLSFIKNALENSATEKFWKERYYQGEEDKKGFLSLTTKENIWDQFLKIFDFEFSSLFKKEIERNIDKEKDFSKILQSVKNTEELLSFDKSKRTISSKIGYDLFSKKFEKLLQNFNIDHISPTEKVIIKNFADSVLTIYQMAKYFALEKKRAWETDYKLDIFYTDPENGYLEFYENAYEGIVQVYNKLRNYLTKKPYSKVKWKLNFENPTLVDGWDKNKEPDNFAVILRKDGKYFLGLMAKGHNKIFDDRFSEKFQENLENGKYEKVVYKLLPGANKMLPKVFFGASNIDFYNPSEKVLEVRNYATHAKNGTPQKGFEKRDFNLEDCYLLIDFFKESIQKHPDWKHFDFCFSETSNYKDISDFYHEVENGGYKISFQDISEKYITEKNQNGELYLFQIKNKDWNEGSNGAKNLHTLYFESLFSVENIAQNFPIKLNGQAEIFYRPKTKDLKKEKIETKKGNILEKGEKAFQKNRFTEDKIFFHVPLTFNRTKGESRYFNAKINNFLVNNSNINIIGVDRGEKHLAYFSVINQKGEILQDKNGNPVSGSLNFAGKDGDGKPIDYAQKLEEKAKNREQARKDWQEVEGIKDLKKGYISQVVRKLADLAIQYNAIIVFEDLNMRFKQIRGGIEKSVYQQLEKALIEKLNFLVNKNEKNPKEAGHLLNAFQLAASFTTFKDMGKQTGILFYTQAAYTSRIDPISGWRPNLYLKYKSSQKDGPVATKEDILNFTKIEFVNGRFEFTYDIQKTQPSKKEYPEKTVWTVCSSVERFHWNRNLNHNKGGYDHYKNVTKNFEELFASLGIDTSQDILEQIKTLESRGNEKFFKDFIFFFNLICQIRNTDGILHEKIERYKRDGRIYEITEKEHFDSDFILSPIEPFFDSRNSENFGKKLPKNGDDNGAFNISRKGILILNKISKFKEAVGDLSKMKWSDLYISNEEWDNFAQNVK